MSHYNTNAMGEHVMIAPRKGKQKVFNIGGVKIKAKDYTSALRQNNHRKYK